MKIDEAYYIRMFYRALIEGDGCDCQWCSGYMARLLWHLPPVIPSVARQSRVSPRSRALSGVSARSLPDVPCPDFGVLVLPCHPEGRSEAEDRALRDCYRGALERLFCDNLHIGEV